MALKTERSRIRFKDIESVEPFEAAPRAGRSAPLHEPPANEERGMSSQPLPVGAELRRAREEAGLDLADVAAHLRIRSNFLSALEEGRPDALPGITYAIGYVRTYAAFLGLEPDVAVRRFKEEAAGLNSKTQLVFPSPAPEGRVPGLVLMLVAAVLVGGAYGGWYWVSERDGGLRDLVPAVPERLAQLIEGDAPSLPQTPTPPDPVTPDPVATAGSYAEANPTGATLPRDAPSGTTPAPAATEPAATEPAPTASAPAEGSVAAVPPQPSAAGAPPRATPSPDAATPDTAAPDAGSPDTVASGVAAPAASTPAAPTPADSAALPSASPDGDAPAAGPAATAPTETAAGAVEETPDVTAPPEPISTAETVAQEPAPSSPALDGADDSDVPAAPRIAGLIGASEAAVPPGRTAAGPVDRVMIRATGDSWVQVRDAQGTALFTRVLREGDIYRVPDKAGLRLATGNAGALQILVDGSPAPSLGDFGEVVRNVALDPAHLAAGTAIGGSR